MKLSVLQTLAILGATLIGTAQADDPCNYAGRVAFVVDGYNHKHGRDVLEVLESKGYVATVMLPMELFSGKDLKKAFRNIENFGHTIGYKVGGSADKQVNDESLRGELEEAKKAYKEALGTDLVHVLFPSTDKKEVVAQYEDLAKSAGLVAVKYTFDTTPAVNTDLSDDLKERVNIPEENSYIFLASGTDKHQYSNVRTALAYLRSHRFKPLSLEKCISGEAGKRKQEREGENGELRRSRRKQPREIRVKPDAEEQEVEERKERGRYLVPSQFVRTGDAESQEDEGGRRRRRGRRVGRRGDRREDSGRRSRRDRHRRHRDSRRRRPVEDSEAGSEGKETNGVPRHFVDSGKEERHRQRDNGKKPSASDKPAVAEKPVEAVAAEAQVQTVENKPVGAKANMKANQTAAKDAKDAKDTKDAKDAAKAKSTKESKDGKEAKDALTAATSAASTTSFLASGAITIAAVALFTLF